MKLLTYLRLNLGTVVAAVVKVVAAVVVVDVVTIRFAKGSWWSHRMGTKCVEGESGTMCEWVCVRACAKVVKESCPPTLLPAYPHKHLHTQNQ